MPVSAIPKGTLYDLVPNGCVVTKQWLRSQGLGAHTIDNLVKSGQLLSAARGVYQRPGYGLEWKGVAASLEWMGYSLLVGGLTALDLRGYRHYIPMGNRMQVHLYGREPGPRWLNKLMDNVTFKTHSTAKLFAPDMQIASVAQVSGQMPTSEAVSARTNAPTLSTYSIEAAYLQVLMDVPHATSFEYADKLMEGLTTLSPKRLDVLLRHCISVKVKRLFFWYAERHEHAWLAKLNSKDYDLGAGKRALAPGGKLDARYNITVPEDMYGLEQPVF